MIGPAVVNSFNLWGRRQTGAREAALQKVAQKQVRKPKAKGFTSSSRNQSFPD